MGNDAAIQPVQEMTEFQKWLRPDINEKDDPEKSCYPILREVAKAVIRWARDSNGKIKRELRDVLLYEEYSSSVGENNSSTEQRDVSTNVDNLTSAVITFIWEFLNNPNRLKDCRVQLSEYLATNNLNGIRSIFIDRVEKYCGEEARKASNSPFHACYRRMRTEISAAAQKPGTEYKYDYVEGQGSYYAITPRLLLKRLLEGKLSLNKFSGWPHPGFSISEIERAVVLLGISDVFWKHSLEVIAQYDELDDPEYLLSIRELVEYVDVMYGLVKPEIQETTMQNEDGDELPAYSEAKINWQPHDPFDSGDRQRATVFDTPDSEFDAAAEKMMQRWKPKTRICFYLHSMSEMSLEAVAARVGLESAEAVRYHIVKITAPALKQVIISNGYDKTEQLRFLQSVGKFILKYHPECRDEEEGESLSNG